MNKKYFEMNEAILKNPAGRERDELCYLVQDLNCQCYMCRRERVSTSGMKLTESRWYHSLVRVNSGSWLVNIAQRNWIERRDTTFNLFKKTISNCRSSHSKK